MVGKQCTLKIEKAKYISTCGGGLNICGPLDVVVVEEVAVVALWAFCGDCGGTGGWGGGGGNIKLLIPMKLCPEKIEML